MEYPPVCCSCCRFQSDMNQELMCDDYVKRLDVYKKSEKLRRVSNVELNRICPLCVHTKDCLPPGTTKR